MFICKKKTTNQTSTFPPPSPLPNQACFWLSCHCTRFVWLSPSSHFCENGFAWEASFHLPSHWHREFSKPDNGRGPDFPNSALLQGCWQQKGQLTPCSLPTKHFCLQCIWLQIASMSKLTGLKSAPWGCWWGLKSPHCPWKMEQHPGGFYPWHGLVNKTRDYSSVLKYILQPETFSDQDLCLSWAPQQRCWAYNPALSPKQERSVTARSAGRR